MDLEKTIKNLNSYKENLEFQLKNINTTIDTLTLMKKQQDMLNEFLKLNPLVNMSQNMLSEYQKMLEPLNNMNPNVDLIKNNQNLFDPEKNPFLNFFKK